MKIALLKLPYAIDALAPHVSQKPLITVDVWEHAYYINHRNARPSCLNVFWDFVQQNLSA